MKPAGQYVMDAYGLGLADFTAEHGCFFLVHSAPAEPVKLDDTGDEWSSNLAYQTTFGPNPAQMTAEVEAAFNAVRDFQVSAVRKRRGNPFPDRISVGRARNCDVVLRYSYVSKLHAHFLLGNPELTMEAQTQITLVDQKSHNGSAVNGHPLEAGRPVPVENGDEIVLGSLRLRLMNAQRFTAFIKRESQRPKSRF
jgi:hypothetical protein